MSQCDTSASWNAPQIALGALDKEIRQTFIPVFFDYEKPAHNLSKYERRYYVRNVPALQKEEDL